MLRRDEKIRGRCAAFTPTTRQYRTMIRVRFHAPRSGAMVTTILAAAAVAMLGASSQPPSDFQPELDAVLSRDLRFSPAELADLQQGKLVRHTLPPAAPDEVGVVGAIRVQGSRDRLMAAYRDIVSFKKNEAVLAIGRFSDPPDRSDLDALTTNRDDLDLRGCKVSDCDIRLPASEIQRIASAVDWRRSDADAQAAGLFKQMLFTHVHSYMTGVPGRVTQYDD